MSKQHQNVFYFSYTGFPVISSYLSIILRTKKKNKRNLEIQGMFLEPQ